ncbi:capsid protein [Olive associated gemycircularvirus 1]|uniref:Capsid protein n=1 Tax=Olive associated gemycircularvirus 1 TaxID=2518602 RepID=A0A411PW70_9VIRU|nr:capsid protein [Olive associated gemycircularvirus 1]QBG49356.1 capsid protein [Olive associated gemycircularvirus 1]
MAYRKKYGLSRVARRTKRSASSYRRGSYAKRPPYRRTKKTYRRTGMTRKRILNATSTKKRNGMLTWTNTTPAGLSQAPAAGQFVVNGRDGATVVWIATGQDLSANGNANTVIQQAARTATTCFMRGLRENIKIQTSSPLPWFHRRICFTIRGISPFNTVSPSDSPVNTWLPLVETSSGMQRSFFNMNINNMPNTRNNLEGQLFRGASGLDWNDIISAPVDTSRVSVKFDKTWTYRSGNQNGTVKELKMWHPMNHNLVYDDDESGAQQATSYFSVDSKAGMGDFIVVDYFQPGLGGTVNDLLAISANSTLYWHEK